MLGSKEKIAFRLLDDSCKWQYIDKILYNYLAELIGKAAEHVICLASTLPGLVVRRNHGYSSVNNKYITT
jgi:hypothetical protein